MRDDGAFEHVNFGKVDSSVTAIPDSVGFEKIPENLLGIPLRCEISAVYEENTKDMPRVKIIFTTVFEGKRIGAPIAFFSRNPRKIYPLLNLFQITELCNQGQLLGKQVGVVFKRKGDWFDVTHFVDAKHAEEGAFPSTYNAADGDDIPF